MRVCRVKAWFCVLLCCALLLAMSAACLSGCRGAPEGEGGGSDDLPIVDVREDGDSTEEVGPDKPYTETGEPMPSDHE